jgi:hypothetical protein
MTSVSEWKKLFALYDFPDAPVVGFTPRIPGPRGNEVDAWRAEYVHKARYCILDDDRDFLEHQVSALVLVDPQFGLSDVDVQLSLRILGD